MSLPDMKPKRERNRFSLILQLGSSKTANDARGKYFPSSSSGTPNSISKPSPTNPFTLTSVSPKDTRLLSPQRDYNELVRTEDDDSYPNSSVPPTLNHLDSAEKANMIKKARKLSRVFGELVVFEQRHSGADGDYSPTFLEAGYLPSSTSSLSRNGSLERQAIPRLPSQPDLFNQIRTSNEIQPEVAAPCQTPFTSAPPQTFADTFTSSPEAFKVDATEVLSHTSTTTSFREADGHSVTSIISRRTQSGNPPFDEDTPSIHEQAKHRSRSPSFRRQSLDPDLLTLTAFALEEALADGKKLRRSLSHRNNATRNADSALDVDSLTAEHKRLLNVKRARKMTQLFGDDPPYELIHITRGVNRDSTGSTSSESICSVASVKGPISASLVRVVSLAEDSPTSYDVQPSSFQERRRRAAKLTQFFGVTYHDISSSLAVPERTVYNAKPTQLHIEDDPTQVDVKISGGSRLWGKSNLRDTNIMDARARLRALKAA